MKKIVNLSSKLLPFLLLITFIFCEPVTSSKGVVKNAKGDFLKDVTVVLEINVSDANSGFEKKSEQKTDEKGGFNFVTISPNAKQSRLVFQKEGYQTLVRELIPNKQNDVEITLESN